MGRDASDARRPTVLLNRGLQAEEVEHVVPHARTRGLHVLLPVCRALYVLGSCGVAVVDLVGCGKGRLVWRGGMVVGPAGVRPVVSRLLWLRRLDPPAHVLVRCVGAGGLAILAMRVASGLARGGGLGGRLLPTLPRLYQ